MLSDISHNSRNWGEIYLKMTTTIAFWSLKGLSFAKTNRGQKLGRVLLHLAPSNYLHKIIQRHILGNFCLQVFSLTGFIYYLFYRWRNGVFYARPRLESLSSTSTLHVPKSRDLFKNALEIDFLYIDSKTGISAKFLFFVFMNWKISLICFSLMCDTVQSFIFCRRTYCGTWSGSVNSESIF
jgi:hypothetical protein